MTPAAHDLHPVYVLVRRSDLDNLRTWFDDDGDPFDDFIPSGPARRLLDNARPVERAS